MVLSTLTRPLRGAPLPGARHRWQRYRRDLARCVNWWAWIPGILGPTTISAGLLLTSALQTEQLKNQLLVRFAQERLNQASQSLIAETKDYAIWDETHQFLQGSNPDYINKNFNAVTFVRTPIVALFDSKGELVGDFYFDPTQRQIKPLPIASRLDLLDLLPPGTSPLSRAFLGAVGGKPYLLSLESVLPTAGQGTSSGRLMFVRGVDTFQSLTLNEAIGIISEQFQRPQPLKRSLLGPIELEIPHPQLAGREPLQHVVIRSPQERIQALQAILLLFLFDLVLLAVIATYSYLTSRHHRYVDLQLLRQQKRLSRDLQQQESTDSLTGLLSEVGLRRGIRDQHERFADFRQLVLHINLDHFAFITSGMGRSGGDVVLIGLARELRRSMHPSALIARTSADEFACCLIGTSEAALLSELSELTQRINQLEIAVEGHNPVSISASVGASFVDPADPITAIHEASVACRITKMGGGGGYQLYGDSHGATSTYLAIQHSNEELLAAIRDDRIRLHAQHAWSLEQGNRLPSVYVELLARIEDADDGHCYWSESLIEAANFCGSLRLLDLHILERAIPAISDIVKAGAPGCRELVYAINVTADVLLTNDFVTQLDRQLEQYGLDPHLVCLELTEQAALRNPPQAISTMKRLRKLGVKLAMDDFGTGTTSLGYLRDLPLDYVKIDKSYVWKLRTEATSRLIIQFVVELGKEIGFSTVAEGVEDEELLRELQELGVSIGQGYLVTRPKPFSARNDGWIFAESGQSRNIFGHVEAPG